MEDTQDASEVKIVYRMTLPAAAYSPAPGRPGDAVPNEWIGVATGEGWSAEFVIRADDSHAWIAKCAMNGLALAYPNLDLQRWLEMGIDTAVVLTRQQAARGPSALLSSPTLIESPPLYPTRRGAPLGDEHLREVAAVYNEAVAKGSHAPANEVAKYFSIGIPTARGRVRLAREKGYIEAPQAQAS